MKPKKQSPIWPYLVVLACLFVLSVTAPRAWERMARQQGVGHLRASRKIRPAAGPGSVRRTAQWTEYERPDAAELKPREPIAIDVKTARSATPVKAFDAPRMPVERPAPEREPASQPLPPRWSLPSPCRKTSK